MLVNRRHSRSVTDGQMTISHRRTCRKKLCWPELSHDPTATWLNHKRNLWLSSCLLEKISLHSHTLSEADQQEFETYSEVTNTAKLCSLSIRSDKALFAMSKKPNCTFGTSWRWRKWKPLIQEVDKQATVNKIGSTQGLVCGAPQWQYQTRYTKACHHNRLTILRTALTSGGVETMHLSALSTVSAEPVLDFRLPSSRLFPESPPALTTGGRWWYLCYLQDSGINRIVHHIWSSGHSHTQSIGPAYSLNVWLSCKFKILSCLGTAWC